MAKYEKKLVNGCEVVKEEIGGRLTFKCTNKNRPPTSQEIIDSLDTEIKVK